MQFFSRRFQNRNNQAFNLLQNLINLALFNGISSVCCCAEQETLSGLFTWYNSLLSQNSFSELKWSVETMRMIELAVELAF